MMPFRGRWQLTASHPASLLKRLPCLVCRPWPSGRACCRRRDTLAPGRENSGQEQSAPSPRSRVKRQLEASGSVEAAKRGEAANSRQAAGRREAAAEARQQADANSRLRRAAAQASSKLRRSGSSRQQQPEAKQQPRSRQLEPSSSPSQAAARGQAKTARCLLQSGNPLRPRSHPTPASPAVLAQVAPNPQKLSPVKLEPNSAGRVDSMPVCRLLPVRGETGTVVPVDLRNSPTDTQRDTNIESLQWFRTCSMSGGELRERVRDFLPGRVGRAARPAGSA